MMKKSIGVTAGEYHILAGEHAVFRQPLTFPYDAQTEWPCMGPGLVPLDPECQNHRVEDGGYDRNEDESSEPRSSLGTNGCAMTGVCVPPSRDDEDDGARYDHGECKRDQGEYQGYDGEGLVREVARVLEDSDEGRSRV